MNLGKNSPAHVNAPSPEVLRRFALVFVPTLLLLSSLVAIFYYQELTNEQMLFQQEAAHIVDLHAEIISRELKSVESDLLYLSGQAKLRDFLSGGNTAKRELQEEYALFCRNRAIYDQIRYLDENGSERIRINYNAGRPAIVDESELQSKATRYYFTETMALERGQVFISPFDLNVEHEQIERPMKPVVRFATPVFDDRGQKRGLLVLNYLGERLLRKLAEVAGRTPGSVLLLNRDGYFLRGRTAEEEWGFMFGKEYTLARSHPGAWQIVRQANDGQFYVDADLFTFRTLPHPTAEAASISGPIRSGKVGTLLVPPAENALTVVSHIPKLVLHARSAQLLRRLLAVDAVVLCLLGVLVWHLANTSELRRQHERRIEESESRLRTLSAQLLNAQEEERRIISRDLHDDLGQLATAVNLDLQRVAETDSSEKRHDLLSRALQGTQQLLGRMHDLSTRLRPRILDELGLKEAAQSFMSEFEHRTGVVTRAEWRFEPHDVPDVVAENIFRILQEALTNVSKHSQAKEVFVRLHVSANEVALVVRDDGAGFSRESVDGKGLGILGMRERAELLGGTFDLQSEPGKGTEIRVRVSF